MAYNRDQLGDMPHAVEGVLRSQGLAVDVVQRGPTFHRLRVSNQGQTCPLDLVAERVPALEHPVVERLEGGEVLVDTVHEILVNKLCALLSRCELRDLQDLEALLDSGANLEQALSDAPRKDTGFSPLTLAWILRQSNPRVLAEALGWSEKETARLARFHESLIRRLLAAARPD